MKTLSIRTLMAVVIIVATGLAALKNANGVWVEGLMLMPLAALAATVLGALLQRGRERVWCLGFALAGGSYLALALVPWLRDTIRPQLGTTHFLDYVYAELIGPLRNQQVTAGVQAIVTSGLAVLDSGGGSANARAPSLRPRYFVRGIANYDHFQRVGHSLFALLAGLLGAKVGAWFYGKREQAVRGEVPSSSGRSASDG
jgi:hypothetical protein